NVHCNDMAFPPLSWLLNWSGSLEFGRLTDSLDDDDRTPLSFDEPKLRIHAVCAHVRFFNVKERHSVFVECLRDQPGDQGARVTASFKPRMRTHGADLAVPRNIHSLAGHRDELTVDSNSEVRAERIRVRLERPGMGQRRQGQHRRNVALSQNG